MSFRNHISPKLPASVPPTRPLSYIFVKLEFLSENDFLSGQSSFCTLLTEIIAVSLRLLLNFRPI